MDAYKNIVGDANVLTDPADMAAYLTDWTGAYTGEAAAVIRPSTTEEVAAVIRLAAETNTAVNLQSGNTSVAGGSVPGVGKGIVLSLARLNKIREIDTEARTATVDAGVILQTLQDKVGEDGLEFPLMFGARGSALIGGTLATNAGGANVLRYGNARDLCLGIEAVLPDGQIVNALTGLRKDNSGYDLKNLLIGSEGTLGVITGAVLKLTPTPKVRSTAFLGLSNIDVALEVLNALQDGSGGLVEAFEWMPGDMVAAILAHNPALRAPLDAPAETGVLVELASTRQEDAQMDEDGSVRLDALMLEIVADLMERELVVDGAFASSEQQRNDLWLMREEVLETIRANGPFLSLDASLSLSKIPAFLERAAPIAGAFGLKPLLVGHLGDGNIHYAVVAESGQDWDQIDRAAFTSQMVDLLTEMGGSYSAEHGIGRAKAGLFARRKEASQYSALLAIKQALDPGRILGSGILFPEDL